MSSSANLIRLLALGIISLVGLTWRLWTPQDLFPQIPLMRFACSLPGWLDWLGLTILLGSASILALFAAKPKIVQFASLGTVVGFAMLFLLDQHRLQPWAWQFFLLAVLVSLADTDTVKRCWGWLVISIYFWSAISKVDWTFCHVQGPALLEAFAKSIGLQGIPGRMPAWIVNGGSLGIAFGELVIALLLMRKPTRMSGLLCATAMHVVLFSALGPFGLKHSLGVLAWNVFSVVQDWLLFFRVFRSKKPSPLTTAPGKSIRNQLATAILVLASLAPILEQFGLYDHWLAWAVYSARPGVVEIIATEPMDKAPPGLFASTQQAAALPRRININEWSLRQTGVPVYPEQRFQLGVVSSLQQSGFKGLIQVRKTPNRLTGRLSPVRSIPVGLADHHEFDDLLDSFVWNAWPRINSGRKESNWLSGDQAAAVVCCVNRHSDPAAPCDLPPFAPVAATLRSVAIQH